MAGHRNRLEKNLIENNGTKGEAAGIRVRGETRDLVIKNNVIRDSRVDKERSKRSASGSRKRSDSSPLRTIKSPLRKICGTNEFSGEGPGTRRQC